MTAIDGKRRSVVSVFAKSTAVSTVPVRPGKTYPLSPLDHLMAAHTLHVVLYLRRSPSVDRDRLKESLSETLSHFPAITGRLFRYEDDGGNWSVKYTDSGVRVVDARADVDMEEWLTAATAAEEKELAYWEPMGHVEPSFWSPYSIQITEFEDKCYAIGASSTHMHADPTTIFVFLRAWSDVHRRSCIVYPPFFHPPGLRSRHRPNTSTPTTRLLALKSTLKVKNAVDTGEVFISTSFIFSDSSVRSLVGDSNVSPFAALAALFWTRIAASSDRRSEASAITICTDFRKRMHAPLPHGFYGNAVHFGRLEMEPAGDVAGAIERHVAGTEEEQYWSEVEWVEGRRGSDGGHAAAFRMYGPELTCVRMDHVFPFAYGAVFDKDGGRSAAHVSCRIGGADGGEGLVVVMPAAEDGSGRVVTAALPPEVAEKVREDPEILKLSPTVLLRD